MHMKKFKNGNQMNIHKKILSMIFQIYQRKNIGKYQDI